MASTSDGSKKKRGRGRPTKFTQEIADRIVIFVRAGNYIETAAAAAGINKDTLYDWLKKGAAQKSGVLRDFSDAITKALAEAEASDLATIGKAAKDGHWQAAAWRLERRNFTRWGKRQKIDLGKFDPKGLSDEELEELANAAATQSHT